MTRHVSAIVLAAGAATRFGAAKQKATIGGRTLIGMVLDTLRLVELDEVLLVLGSRAEEVGERLDLRGVRVVVNKEFKKGMSSSLRTGVESVSDQADAVLVVLADQPFVPPAHIRRMLREYQSTGNDVIASGFGDQISPPMLFSRRIFPSLLRLSGDVGAKAVASSYRDAVRVAPSDPIALMDIDTRQDLAKARRMLRETERARGGRRPKPSRP